MKKMPLQAEERRSMYDESMLREMGYMNAQIGQGNAIIQQGFQEIQRSIGQVKRKQRKSLVDASVALLQNGEIALAETYDDGSRNLNSFILNVRGTWHVYRVQFRYIESMKNYFAIYFPESRWWIIGDVAKNTESGLYDYFIRGNVKFAANLSKSKIKRALFEKFGPEIDLCRDMFTFPELAGWIGECFVSAENFAFPVTKDFPCLPVLRKHFYFFVAEDERFVRVVRALKCIKSPDLRAMLFAFPLSALSASIFAEEGLPIPVILNFIPDDGRLVGIVGSFFQIFNRQEVKFISLDNTFTNLLKYMAEAKDEILNFSVPYYTTMEGYRRRKVAENLERIINSYFHPELRKNGTESPAHAITFISDRVIKYKSVINIFVEKSTVDDFEKIGSALSGSTMPEVFTAFISFVAKNLTWLRNLVHEEKKEGNLKQAFGEILRRLLVKFGEYVELDFVQELNLDLVDFGSLFIEDEVRGDDLSELLMNAIRKEIVHFPAQNKKMAVVLKTTYIYFDADYLWISPQILRMILGKNGVLPQKNRILHEAREKRMLITDTEGYTRKMMISRNPE